MQTTVHKPLDKFQILQLLNFFSSHHFTVFLHCESTKTWQGFSDIKVSRCLDKELNIITNTKPAKILLCLILSPWPSALQRLWVKKEYSQCVPTPWNKFKVLTCQEAAPQWSFPLTQQAASHGWLLSGAGCLSSPGLPEQQHKLLDKALNHSLEQCLQINPKRTLEQTFQNDSIGKKPNNPN